MARESMQNPVISGPEEITNFNNALLEQKTLFSKQVKNFVTGLSYGAVCCDEDDNLRNFQRKLDILTNYDTRDIYNCTPTEYYISSSERFISTTDSGDVPTGRIKLSTLSAGGLHSISVSKKQYLGYDVENFLIDNFNVGSTIRLTNSSSLENTVTSEPYIITAKSDDTVKVDFSLIPLSSINTLGGVDFNFDSQFIDISINYYSYYSDYTSLFTFNRSTSGILGYSQFKSSPSATTTNFSAITAFDFSGDIDVPSLDVGYLILYSDPNNYAVYTIIHTYALHDKVVSIVASLGTFSTNTSINWYVSQIDNTEQFLNTIQTSYGICTQDTTNYNNISYTEIKNLLNS